MKALRRDLFERRLWPLVIALLAACAVVPVLLLRHPQSSDGRTGTAPSVTSQTTTTTVGASGKRGAASASVGTARRASRAPATVTAAQVPRDPFANATTTTSATTSTSSTSSSPTAQATTTTPLQTESSSGATGSTSSSSSSSSTTTSTTTTTPSTTTASATTASASSSGSSTKTWTIYAVDVRVGKASAPVKSDLPRLSPLPSAKQPDVMYLGVLSGGKQAAFALAAGVDHSGPGICRPVRQLCSTVVLRAGQTEQFTVFTTNGQMWTTTVRVVRVRSWVTHSASTAKSAYERYSSAGLCDLALAQPTYYETSTGTLTEFASAACEGQPHLIPFPAAVSGQ